MKDFRIRFTCDRYDYPIVFHATVENEEEAKKEFETFSSECSCGLTHEIVSVEDTSSEIDEDEEDDEYEENEDEE